VQAPIQMVLRKMAIGITAFCWSSTNRL